MKRPYYHTPERQAVLLQEARSWIGTPFSENCAVKGPQGGVDCAHLMAACHEPTGICRVLDLPALTVEAVRAWHVHHGGSLILGWLERPEVRHRLCLVKESEPRMIGDMVVLRLQQTEHHLALWAAPDLIHVAIPAGVVAPSVRDKELLKLIRCTYRIVGEP